MRKVIAACAVALAIFGLAGHTSAEGEPAPKIGPEFQEVPKAPLTFEDQVEDAVDRGCDWLKKQQQPDGLWPEGNSPTYGAGTPHKYEVGRSAFPIWALCKSGVFADDPVIEKAMNWLRKNYGGRASPSQGDAWCSYENACVVNAVEAYYISRWEAKNRGLENPAARVKKDADNKVIKDAKGKPIPLKRWGTEEKGAKKAREKKVDRQLVLDGKDRQLAERAVKALEEGFMKAYGTGGWRYKNPENNPGTKIDISATQYAMLGFGCASRLGIKYKKEIAYTAYMYFMSEQDKDGPKVVREEKKDGEEEKEEPKEKPKDPDKGTKARTYKPKQEDRARGWGYSRRDPQKGHEDDTKTYGSMTCAGICALTIIRDEMIDDPVMAAKWTKEVDAKCNQAIADGLAWMVMNWSVQQNPARGMYRFYYYLYALERLAMLGGLDFIGKHDWYYEGAKVMLDQQNKDGKDNGGWTEVKNEVEPAHIYNTCYALLFLKRATDGVKRPVPVFTGDDQED